MRVRFKKIKEISGGLATSSLIALISIYISHHLGVSLLGFSDSPISPVVIAIMLGMTLKNRINLPESLNQGLQFSSEQILRFGIILMGIRIGLNDMVGYGMKSLMVVVPLIISIIYLVKLFRRFIKIPPKLTTLIAVGTSICGATAITAISPVIGARKEEVGYAIANVTIFGLIAMILYPILANNIFPNDAISAGIFLGSSIHETAQVAGAGLIYSDYYNQDAVLNISTITKLMRNTAMIFIIPYFSIQYLESKDTYQNNYIGNIISTFPKFIIGFIILGIVRNIGDIGIINFNLAFGFIKAEIWNELIAYLVKLSKFSLIVAMSAVGMKIKFSSIKTIGPLASFYGFIISCSVGLISLTLIKLFV